MKHKQTIQHYLQTTETNLTKVSDGWDFEVYLTPDYVFRFPRTPEVKRGMQSEKLLLDAIKPLVHTLQIPQFDIPNGEYLVGPCIHGSRLPDQVSVYTDAVIDQLVQFLHELDSIPYDAVLPLRGELEQASLEPSSGFKDFVVGFQSSLAEKITTHVPSKTINLINRYLDELFFSFDTPNKGLVHGDLQGKNMLYDPQTGRLAGILDFTDARRGSREDDLANLYKIDQTLLQKVIERYRGSRDQVFFDNVVFLSKRAILFEINKDGITDNNKEKMLDGLRFSGFL